jgi:ribosomal-protein-alanine N-acetyltransferase
VNLFQGEEIRVNVRIMVRRDFAEVQSIEESCFEFPWTEQEFLSCLQQPNCLGLVAECEGKIAGFLIYEMSKGGTFITNIAVDPALQRHNIARQMIQKLVTKMLTRQTRKLVIEIRETNLSALLCFRALGFRASNVLKNFYEGQNEDAYVLQYRLGKELALPVYTSSAGRLSELIAG